MNNNLTLSVTLTGDGRQLSGTLRDAQGEVREFGSTTERESRKADAALATPGRQANTVSGHLRGAQREARAFGAETVRGGQEATQALAETGRETQTVSQHMSQLRTMVGLALGAFSVRQMAGMVDGWSDMRSVVGAAIGDMDAAGDMMRRITDIANASYAPLEQTARTYASNVSALRDLGRTAAETADYTESLNHHLVLTATRGQQAESVQNALSRAMAVGKLQADGLETVLANGGEVAQSLANHLGVTVSQLRGLASEGKITGDVIASALIGSLDDVRERAGEMPATIEDGFVRIGTSATRLVGEMDQALGFSGGVADIMIRAADAIGDSIDPLIANISVLQSGITIVGAAAGAYVTYRSVLVGVTVAQWAFNAAVRANPLGIFITLLGGAVGAIYAFRDEMGLAGDTTYQTTLDVDGLTSSFHLLTAAQQENRRASIVGDLTEMRLEAGRLTTELEEVSRLVRESGQLTPEGGALPIATAEDIARGRELRHELEQLHANIEGGTEILSKYDEIMAELGETTQTTQTQTRTLAETSTAAARSANELAKAAADQASALEALRNRLVPNRRETVALAQDQNTLNLAFAMGRIGINGYLSTMALLHREFIEAQKDTADTAAATADQISVNVSTWATVSENAIRRVDDAGVDLWLGFIDGSRGALDTVKRGFQQTLAEIAHMLTTQRLTIAVAGALGMGVGGAGGVGGVGSGGGFGISPGSINNAWQALQGGVGGIQWGGVGSASAYGGTGFANAATSGFGQTGLWGGSLNNFSGMQGLAGLGAGLAGNWLGGQLFGTGKHSNTLGALGGLAGTYFGGPIGALLGSGLGSALGGLFGRSWKETGSGVNLGITGGNITGNQFSEQYSKGGLFRSSKRRTHTSALDGEFARGLQEVYDATEASLAATIEVLGFQSSALAGFTTGLTRIDTKGLSAEDAEAKIQEWLSNTLNALAIHSVGDVSQFAMGGETAIDTLERLAVALSGINPILQQLHDTTLAASLAGGDAANHLLALAGGVEAFTTRADYYYQNILTETERQERALSAAAQAMGAFTARTGRVIDSTDALRELVDGIDLTTTSGRELYNEAMNLAPALVEIERGLARVGQRFDDMLRDAESAFADAEAQARRAYQVFDQQQYGMQLELLALMGDAEGALALERERELASIDESLRPMRERIWAMQDEAAAQQQATQAAQSYIRELSRVRDQLSQSLANIGNWLDQQLATSGTPGMNLETAQEQFAKQLVLAENGDRNALQNITQYAQQVLDANRDYNASSAAGQRIQQDVFDALKGLPEAISDAEYIVEGFRGIVSNEMAAEIERAIFASQYTIDALIDFAADASALPQDLRTILGQQAHTLDSTLNYLLGENQLDAELRRLALASSNNLVATVDYIARRQLSDGDKRLALNSSNTMAAMIDYVVRSELDRDSKRLALESSNRYSSVIDMILGRDITAADRTLALASTSRFTTTLDYAIRADLDAKSRQLALASGNYYEAMIGYYTDTTLSAADRRLALESANSYISNIDLVVKKNLSSDDRRLALTANNSYVSTINQVLGKKITGDDRRLALHAANAFTTTVNAVLKSGIPADVRTFALGSSNTIMATVNGVLARNMPSDVKTLALEHANTFTTTLHAALADGKLSADERRVLDAQSETIVKTLKTGGGLNLTTAEWAVINAASGTRRLELLADVAFGRADLAHLSEIDENTKPLAEQARNQLKELTGLVGEMARTTDQFVGLNSNIVSLRDSINALGVAQDEIARIEKERAVRDVEDKARITTGRIESEWSARNSAQSQIAAIEDWGRGKDINRLRPIAEQGLQDGVSGWHYSNGKYREWTGWQSGFDELTGNLRNSGLADMTDRQFATWLKDEKRKHSAGTWGAEYIETLANRIRAQELIAKSDRDNAHKDSLYNQLSNYNGSIEAHEQQLADLRKEYKSLTGSAAPFATGGIFEHGRVVDTSTRFSIGEMGEAGPEMILPVQKMQNGKYGMQARLAFDMPAISMPLPGNSDVVDAIRDLRREVIQLRKENAQLQREGNKHAAAGNTQRGAAALRQIDAINEGNRMLRRMQDNAALEGAKR